MIRYSGPEQSFATPAGSLPAESARLLTYEVTLGYHLLRVQAPDADRAVAEARRRLCAELPRLWDVIRDLDRHRFQVRLV